MINVVVTGLPTFVRGEYTNELSASRYGVEGKDIQPVSSVRLVSRGHRENAIKDVRQIMHGLHVRMKWHLR